MKKLIMSLVALVTISLSSFAQSTLTEAQKFSDSLDFCRYDYYTFKPSLSNFNWQINVYTNVLTNEQMAVLVIEYAGNHAFVDYEELNEFVERLAVFDAKRKESKGVESTIILATRNKQLAIRSIISKSGSDSKTIAVGEKGSFSCNDGELQRFIGSLKTARTEFEKYK